MVNKTLDRIMRVLKMHENELRERYGVKRIGIFGSYVRGEERRGSDLDILVEFHPDAEIDLIKFVELEEYLSELLGIKVDLVMKSSLKPRIRRRVLQEVIYV